MSRGMTFTDSKRDRELVNRINEFRHEKDISFTEAVRILCDTALKISKITKS